MADTHHKEPERKNFQKKEQWETRESRDKEALRYNRRQSHWVQVGPGAPILWGSQLKISEKTVDDTAEERISKLGYTSIKISR